MNSVVLVGKRDVNVNKSSTADPENKLHTTVGYMMVLLLHNGELKGKFNRHNSL